jgi:hypothetical protein
MASVRDAVRARWQQCRGPRTAPRAESDAMIEHEFSRKRFVAGAGLGVAGLALPAVASATSHKQLAVFRLNPDAGVCDGPGAACACKACYGHTAKLFPSTEAANANRAHPYCNCGIERAGTIPYGKWVALFGEPRHILRDSADRRDTRVAAILKHTSPAA